jgi:peptidoglycan/LPS O-acetylase OafA/YrhL
MLIERSMHLYSALCVMFAICIAFSSFWLIKQLQAQAAKHGSWDENLGVDL